MRFYVRAHTYLSCQIIVCSFLFSCVINLIRCCCLSRWRENLSSGEKRAVHVLFSEHRRVRTCQNEEAGPGTCQNEEQGRAREKCGKREGETRQSAFWSSARCQDHPVSWSSSHPHTHTSLYQGAQTWSACRPDPASTRRVMPRNSSGGQEG